MNKRIVNIVDFVRGTEPRDPTSDLFLPTKMQMEIAKAERIPTTFLLQYDAMLRDDFRSLFLKEKAPYIEIGVWLENCRELIEKIGLKWNGRPGYDWDWYANVGFLEGYTTSQRKKIIDEVFGYFFSIFGYYPRVVGSWILDVSSIKYMVERYDVKGFCICREQYAVDAYTLWGGFYNGGYYPSKNNMLCPAQSKENQINAPIFRMLGIDPIYGYDEWKYLGDEAPHEGCFTLEPAWYSGQNNDIVDWYLKEYFSRDCLSFSHLTTGQENSFFWPNMEKGYRMQIEKLKKLADKGHIVFGTLLETSINFASAYKSTPPQTLMALSSWAKRDHKSIWYNSKFYRSNLFLNGKSLYFRDIRIFNDQYKERYINRRLKKWDATYDNLPVVDSRIWSENGNECALKIENDAKDVSTKVDGDNLEVDVTFSNGKKGKIIFFEKKIKFIGCGSLIFALGELTKTDIVSIKNNMINYSHRNFRYSLATNAEIIKKGNQLEFISSRDIELYF